MKRGVVALILSIIVLILLIACLMLPWYSQYSKSTYEDYDWGSPYGSEKTTQTQETTVEFNINSLKTKTESSYVFMPAISITYSDYEEYLDSRDLGTNSSKFEDMISIYNNTFYIFLAGLIMSILALALTLVSILPTKYFNTIKKVSGSFCIIVFILSIIAVLYFFFALSAYIEEDYVDASLSSSSYNLSDKDLGFWYSDYEDSNEFSIGPGISWYLMFITGLFSLISAILLFSKYEPWSPEMYTIQKRSDYQSGDSIEENYTQDRNYPINEYEDIFDQRYQ